MRIGNGQVGEFNHEYFKIKNAMQFLNNIYFKIQCCFHNHHIYYPIFSFGHNESSKNYQHWIWLTQMKSFEETIYCNSSNVKSSKHGSCWKTIYIIFWNGIFLYMFHKNNVIVLDHYDKNWTWIHFFFVMVYIINFT